MPLLSGVKEAALDLPKCSQFKIVFIAEKACLYRFWSQTLKADYLDVAVITVVPCSGLLIMLSSQLYGLQLGLRVRALVLPHYFSQTVIILF